MRRSFASLVLLSLTACASDEGASDKPKGSGGSGGVGLDGGGGFPSGGTGGSAGAASCDPSAPTTGSLAALAKDVLVTDSFSQRTLAIAFDSTAHAWAISNVFLETSGNFPLEIRKATESAGKLTLSERVLVIDDSAPAVTNSADPSLASATGSSRMLLVWADDRIGNGNGLIEIFGQFFDLTGAVPKKIGDNFSISAQPTTDEKTPTVVFDAASQKFWVAWADDRQFKQIAGGRFEYARSVALDGSLGPELALGDGTTWEDGVHAAVGSAGALFVWSEYSDPEGWGRYRGRLASAPPSELIELYKSTSLVPAPPTIAWDRKRCRFLAVWQETASANEADKQVWGALLGPDGKVLKPRFQITNQPAGAGVPHVAYAPATQSFVVTFGSWTDSNAYTVELDDEGGPVGPPSSMHSVIPKNGTYYHDVAASDGTVLVISNDDYVRIDATLLGPG